MNDYCNIVGTRLHCDYENIINTKIKIQLPIQCKVRKIQIKIEEYKAGVYGTIEIARLGDFV